jgi:succinate-semialdehyde dehydrogenase/glutarate-semialdehyde dehydrogenase
MLSFTGSTEVGRVLLRRAADRVLKTVMELGGNAPFVVFDDADIDAAVEGAMVAKMRHSAETCTAANRFYVEAGAVDEFSEKLTAAMGAVKVGNGFEEGVTCGPMINQGAVKDIDGLVRGAVTEGASLLLGGEPGAGAGFFYPATVLRDVQHGSSISQVEIFGPVAPIIPFTDEAEALALANATEAGLAAYFYTRDAARAVRVAEGLECGMVGHNTGLISNEVAPFGGIKQSGLGREGSRHGIDEYLELKYVCSAIA